MKRIKIYKLIKSFIIDKQTKEGLTMNKLLNNLENKLKDVEQDIISLHALNSCENDVSDSIDFKEEQKEDLEELIDSVNQLKRNLENDNTITNVLSSFKCFKESIEMNEEFRTNNVWLNYIPNELNKQTKG